MDPDDLVYDGKADITGHSEPTYGGLTDAASLDHVAAYRREQRLARTRPGLVVRLVQRLRRSA